MKPWTRIVGAGLLALVGAPLSAAAQDLGDTDRVWTLETQWGEMPRYHARAFVDIVYDEDAVGADGWWNRALDVYVPCATTEARTCRSEEDFQLPDHVPVLIYIHGGASIGGDKQWAKDLGVKPVWAMVDLGYVFVSINYRLRDAGDYPVAQQDAANAIAWVYENIERYGGDPERIVVMGHSAGASLTTRIATDASFLENAGHDLSIIEGAITIDGGSMRAADGDVAAPIDQIAMNENVPPFLSLHVGNGGGSQQDAEAFVAALNEAGITAHAVELVGYNHFTANEGVGLHGDSATVAVERFLVELGLLDEASGTTGYVGAGR